MRVGFGKRGEVRVLPGDESTVPQGGDRARQAVLDEFMRGDGLQQVCDWIAERAPRGKGRAKRRRGPEPRRKKQVIAIPTTVRRKLPASQVVPAQGVTGERGSVALDALLVEPGSEKQLLALSAPADGSPAAATEKGTRAEDLWANQTRSPVEARILLKTHSWDVQGPGFTEVDLVQHSGNSAEGTSIPG